MNARLARTIVIRTPIAQTPWGPTAVLAGQIIMEMDITAYINVSFPLIAVLDCRYGKAKIVNSMALAKE